MWSRSPNQGRHERLPVSSNPSEINQASVPASSQEESLNTSSGQPNPSDPQPLEREQTTSDNYAPDRSSGTPNNNSDGADGVPTVDNTILDGSVIEVEGEGSETRMELMELASSRSLRRRRLFICTLVLSLLLLRLYIQSIINSDFALFWACLILTSWLMRWIHSQREAEELIDGRMDLLWREAAHRGDDDDGEAMTADDRRRQRRRRRNRQRAAAVDGEQELNIRMLSFQAQLSMAIMESQRHMLVNGGFGRPDGPDAEENIGVSEEAKQRWDRFKFDKDSPVLSKMKSEDNTCCICLAEYEPGDDLYVVTCGHAYHIDCIDSWCTSHARCPLCNFNLEDGHNDDMDEENCGNGIDESESHGSITGSGGLSIV